MNEHHSSSEEHSRGDEGSSANETAASAVSEEETFVKKETRRVFFLRLLVIAVLLAAAAAVSVVVYFITSTGEEQEFETQYESAAEKVKDTFLSIARHKMGPAGSLVVALVAHGVDHVREWPFVTLSSFQQRSTTAKQQSGAISIATHPIVYRENRLQWENYTRLDVDRQWYEEGREYQVDLGVEEYDLQPQIDTDDPVLDLSSGIASHIYNFRRDDLTKAMVSPMKPFYLPVWQTSPVSKRTIVNQNRASNSDGILTCLEKNAVVFEGMQAAKPGFQDSLDPVTSEIASLLSISNGKETRYDGDIFTTVFFPIYDSFENDRATVGVMSIVIYWQNYFRDVLPEHMKGVVVVLDDGCDEPFTYQIDGNNVMPLGRGDLHDPEYDGFERIASFLEITRVSDGTKSGMHLNHEKCPYSVRIYPSALFYDRYNSKTPITITIAVALVFVFTIIMFVVYDRLVEKRQQLIMRKAKQTHRIVASLFPKNVRDRLFQEQTSKEETARFLGAKTRIKSFLNDGTGVSEDNTIADLFPEATVFFSDIAGFTAWSSTREPSQVFTLLQALYQAYDKIASRRSVFKVETIGDSYVAVAGVPDPQPKHAVIMARFAAECMMKTNEVTRQLEPILGPGTGDLQIRIGLHSGPVTAGVLIGDRARFQLFGDTVNTASRMESTGQAGMVQISKATADLLIKDGKQHWVRPREDDVDAKGKGVLQTFWVNPRPRAGTSNASSSEAGSFSGSISAMDQGVFQNTKADQNDRLIDWMVELLLDSIKKIKAMHKVTKKEGTPLGLPTTANHASINELVDSFNLPSFDPRVMAECSNRGSTEVNDDVATLLRDYVMTIASSYRANPFHNFEHACHVTMSAQKFLSRIVSTDLTVEQSTQTNDVTVLHNQDYTHGICSDPVAMFAIVFSAFIHDVDHRGVSNNQLRKEQPALSARFQHKCIAEQNSLEIAWNMLVSDRFKALREGIFASQEEFAHFRQVVVNVVLSTDIFDQDMSDLRKKRWEMAFSESLEEDSTKTNNMRATVVIEHIIQASDVCHTMQHWHIYRRWNKALFHELLLAYHQGRFPTDPSAFWYKGELNFFQDYIIPLAKKLKDCKVFGVSSDECLNYALRNHDEWEVYGSGIVEEMKAEFNEKYSDTKPMGGEEIFVA